jgi:flagellin-like protein
VTFDTQPFPVRGPGGLSTVSRTSDRRAVSPVIAIILVVAITVVLAGVIGSIAMNMGSDVSQSAEGGATVEFKTADAGGEVWVTYVARGNTEKLEVEYTVSPGGNSVSPDAGTVLQEPGKSVVLTEDAGNPDQDITVDVTVVAFLEGGEKSVVLEKSGQI